jgi:hypothetical protein
MYAAISFWFTVKCRYGGSVEFFSPTVGNMRAIRHNKHRLITKAPGPLFTSSVKTRCKQNDKHTNNQHMSNHNN